MSAHPLGDTQGPFRADQVRCGDPYELDNGHPVECLPGGGRHSRANLAGGLVLGTDPDVDEAGVDTGYAPDEKTLRAPDIAVGNVPDRPGWIEGVPPLAVEYADQGQDEADLEAKIATLLAAGTRHVWVVRMGGPRQVEVHEPGKPMRLARLGERLEAPGVLRNAVPVEALYEPAAAQDAALVNLLQRQGYADLNAVRAEGRAKAELELVLRQLRRRLPELSEADEAAVEALAPGRLGSLAEALLDFQSIEDLADWLRHQH